MELLEADKEKIAKPSSRGKEGTIEKTLIGKITEEFLFIFEPN